MERIVRMRKEVPEIGWGDFSFLPSGTPHVLAMRYAWRGNLVPCVHNMSSEPQEVHLSLPADDDGTCTLINLLSEDHSYPEANSMHRIVFEPYGYCWFRVCGLDPAGVSPEGVRR
jgi:maltose alpha-D-glucosyltransferase / alpha-amylase